MLRRGLCMGLTIPSPATEPLKLAGNFKFRPGRRFVCGDLSARGLAEGAHVGRFEAYA
jgi:hypothetical protein